MIKEIKDFIRFFWKTSKEEKAIIFYAEHEGYYPNFEGLIKELIGIHKQTLCYITSELNDPILRTLNPQIKSFYLNKLLPIFMAFVNCKVFIMTLTDLNQYHLKRSANPVHYIYVFHALVSTHMVYRYGAFDYYDSILCVGPHQIKEIRKHEQLNSLKQKILVEAGYYRLERIYQKYTKYLENKVPVSKNGTILIAPSWGRQNVLESCGDQLVMLLLDSGYNVIVRPHPETVRRNPELIELLANIFGSNPSFTLETSVATDDSIIQADVLICDCSGIALEYAFGTERPVLFLDVPKKIQNESYEELGIEPLELSIRPIIGKIVPLEKLESVLTTITKLVASKDKYKQRLASLRNKNVYAFCHSSEIGAKHILDIVQGNIETVY